MKKIFSLLLAALMLFGAMASLTACGVPEDSGAQINVYLGDAVFDFDPSDYYVDSNAEQIMSLLYEPLFKLDKNGKLKCAAADDYEINEKENEIVIQLRESYWSDEIRVKATDFIYAWRDVIMEPNNSNPASALFFDIENAIAIKNGEESLYSFGAVATGTYEITIKCRQGADYNQLLRNLASVAASPLREDVVSTAKTYWSKSVATIVTNGPFKIESLDYSVGDFTLARNNGYHQKPTVEDYTKKVNPASLVSFFTGGEALELTYADIESKTVFFMSEATLEDRDANAAKAKSFDDFSTYTYVFNTENRLFAKKEVRKALSLALDRVAIAEAVTFAKAANGVLPNNVAKSIYGSNITDRLAHSLDEANALLETVDFSGLSKSFKLTVNDDEQSIAIAELAQAAWEELGFEVKIEKVYTQITDDEINITTGEKEEFIDSGIQAMVKDAANGVRDFDVIAVDWQMYSDDAFVALASFSSNMNGCGKNFQTGNLKKNISGWSNNDYDAYMNFAYNAENEKDRNAALIEAEKILIDSAPIIPILYNQNFAFVSEELSSVEIDGFGNFVFTETEQKNYQQYLPKDDEQ